MDYIHPTKESPLLLAALGIVSGRAKTIRYDLLNRLTWEEIEPFEGEIPITDEMRLSAECIVYNGIMGILQDDRLDA